MAWKYVFLGTGLSVAVIAYWLYSPLPDGYSFSSAGQIQMMLASTKVVDLVVGECNASFCFSTTVNSVTKLT